MSPPPFPLPKLALAVLVAAYGAILIAVVGAVAGGADNSGYFNEARLFSKGSIRTPMRVLPGVSGEDSPYLYSPLGFKPAPDGSRTLVPTYPPGLPLLLAAGSVFVGWAQTGNAVLILHALAGLVLIYALGRRCGLPEYWSLGACAILSASPLYLFLSAQALSDVPAVVWATAAVVAALESRDSPRWALASGICFSVGFLVRPSNLLVALPVLVAVGASPRRLALVALGALPGVAAWAAINRSAYGGYLVSGYGSIGGEFNSALVGGTLLFYLRWLPLLLGPAVLIAPALPLLRGLGRRIPAVLSVWAFSLLAFYSAYRWTHEDWWFLRFVLPAAPALLVAGLLVVHRATGAMRRRHVPLARIAPVLLLAISLAVEASQTKRFKQAWTIGDGERKYGRIADYVHSDLPRDSVLAVCQASGALFYFTDMTLVRCDQMDANLSGRIQASIRASGRPLYLILFPYERDYIKNIPGGWRQVGSVDDVTIWRSNSSEISK